MTHHLPAIAYFRNFIFGVEDSLVSTVGLLSGVAVAGAPRETILLTGIVLIFVEAFSMAAGSFLSESSAEEYGEKSSGISQKSFFASVIMFFSYFLSGFIPLAPYLILSPDSAFWVSVVSSLIALGILGVVSGVILKGRLVRHALRMTLVGGIAICVGIVAGMLVG